MDSVESKMEKIESNQSKMESKIDSNQSKIESKIDRLTSALEALTQLGNNQVQTAVDVQVL